ncbi:hypothetical protein RHMOL_Rhmol04G0125300 [Rhododendron molle]|uniref:Uncharacterized protein n=2 Tax=Rhododendron molle TaxID=49168 RepID=A0ACC0NZV6_RHOML|nr:hypothetical protein RHMOL_Rhmol04G0125300 [Rhododendron molle]KAI8558806.1 hypothetical protein RHMOL_Rhmol04G0125300 [Rhododendron molle]
MAATATYPPPPPYYKLYKDYIQNPNSAPEPPPPIEGTYVLFGANYTTDDVLPSLEEQGVRHLYPTGPNIGDRFTIPTWEALTTLCRQAHLQLLPIPFPGRRTGGQTRIAKRAANDHATSSQQQQSRGVACRRKRLLAAHRRETRSRTWIDGMTGTNVSEKSTTSNQNAVNQLYFARPKNVQEMPTEEATPTDLPPQIAAMPPTANEIEKPTARAHTGRTASAHRCDFKNELRSLNRELQLHILELADVLVERPSQYARRVEDISLIFKNLHHLLNSLRPHQGRATLIHLLESQIQRRKQAVEDIKRYGGEKKRRNCLRKLLEHWMAIRL